MEYIMPIWSPRNRLVASLLLAGVGLVLFFDGNYHALGLPLGMVGVWMFVIAVWFLVDAVNRTPRSDAELAIAPGEWQSWVGLAFMTALLLAMLQKAPLFMAHLPINENPDAGATGRSIGTLFVAWLVLSHVLRRRWQGKVVEDERDRQIAETASGWGRTASTVAVIALAVTLGFSPTQRLQTFSYPLIAHALMITIVAGAWVDYAVTAWLYWRERRAVPA